MTSSRPYLIRGLYEWIMDNAKTPYIVVNAELDNVVVPQAYVKQGKIVLNISHEAVDSIVINNTEIQFKAKFSGVAHHLYIPIQAVLAIYAQENGAGMVFGQEPGGDSEEPPVPPATNATGKKSHLKIVK